ncbi:MAG: hypothetical protein CVV58_04390 [Tenericutes bacterium HGW-Tenericutes-3]|nr:MAG: hypothetical protein CVV58_04390 [Tenericutes bacterium HGW-Tenericutes-3]
MKKKDFIWILVLVLFSLIVIVPQSRTIFEKYTALYPYVMGFIKTAILASLGERLVHRIKKGSYFGDKGILLKLIVWGFLGMVFVVIFKIFAGGVVQAQAASLLPSIEGTSFISSLLTAFLISLMMNVFFAPSFMLFHRVTDLYIELSDGDIKKMVKVPFKEVTSKIDLHQFLDFVVLKTIPLFWIPAHTITFLLPENYRVLMAAYLSVVLGVLLSVAKAKKTEEK